jgi:ATP-dependent DNA helicase RecQ
LEKDKGKYPTLATTSEGRDFLTGGGRIELTAPNRDSESPTRRIREESTPTNPELFEKLRELRKEIADERSVPPYVIFSNAALLEMARRIPRTLDAFGSISGVGRVKLEQFSGPFLEVIQDYALANGIAETAEPEVAVQRTNRPKERTRRRDQISATLNETKELISRKMSIGQIAKHRGLTGNTILNHIVRIVDSGEDLDLAHMMPSPERAANIKAAFLKTDGVLLTPVRELLGEDYSYEELALVRMGMTKNGS